MRIGASRKLTMVSRETRKVKMIKDFRRRSWLLYVCFALSHESWLRESSGFVPLSKRRSGKVNQSLLAKRESMSRLTRRPFVSETLHESAVSIGLDLETVSNDLPPQTVVEAAKERVEERKYLLHKGQSVGMIRGSPALGGVTVCRGWSDDATKAFVTAVESIGTF